MHIPINKRIMKSKNGTGIKFYGCDKDKCFFECEMSDEILKRPLTIQVMFKLGEDSYKINNSIISFGPKTSQNYFTVFCNQWSRELMVFYPEFKDQVIVCKKKIESRKWNHLVVMVDEETMDVYLDCNKVMSIENENEGYGSEFTSSEYDYGLLFGGDGAMFSFDGVIGGIKLSGVKPEGTISSSQGFRLDENTIEIWDFKELINDRYVEGIKNGKRGYLNFPRDISLDALERLQILKVKSPSKYICGKATKIGKNPEICTLQNEILLDGDWMMAEEGAFSESDRINEYWEDAISAKVPGSVHLALIEEGLLVDPQFGHNAALAKSISHKNWWFKKKFRRPEFENVLLEFDGVCAECDVWLNGLKLGYHNGAFGGPIYQISEVIKDVNELIIKLRGIPEGSPWTAWYDIITFNCNFGWHYVNLPSIGIWKSVRLKKKYSISFERAFVFCENVEKMNNNLASVYIEMESNIKFIGKIVGCVVPKNFEGEITAFEKQISIEEGMNKDGFEIEINSPEFWWPNGYGKQRLYDLSLTLCDEKGNAVFVQKTTFGLRVIEMDVEDINVKSNEYSWRFIVNGKKIFVKGANWCTMDALMDFGIEKYDRFLTLAKNQHMQILRAWGGGVVETDEFYDICDEYGIMVLQEWQTCWNSHFKQPYDPFIETVELNTMRIRNHPSLIMWCAGNESAVPYGKTIDMMQKKSIEMDGTRPFHRGDGFGNEHIHIIWEDSEIERYVNMDNTMLNEFGLVAMPNYESCLRFLPKSELTIWPPMSGSCFYEHLPVFNQRSEMKLLNKYVKDFGEVGELEDFILMTQVAQTTSLRHKIERARCRWPEETGIMYYKLNDVYIGASWSTVDFYGVPKDSYYFVQDSCSPYHACVIFEKLNYEKEVEPFVVNFLNDPQISNENWCITIKIYTSELREMYYEKFEFVSKSEPVQKIGEINIENQEISNVGYVVCVLECKDKSIYQNTFYWLNYKKHKNFMKKMPKTNIEYVTGKGTITVRNISEVPAVCVKVDCGKDSNKSYLDDNCFWLEAGEKRTILINSEKYVKEIRAWNL